MAALALASSMQSITPSNFAINSELIFSILTNSSISTTSADGLIRRMRSAIAVTLALPKLPSSACNCRFTLDSAILSKSIKVIVPTALRASASAAQLPTPPMPIIQICEACSLAKPVAPYNRATPPKRRALSIASKSSVNAAV